MARTRGAERVQLDRQGNPISPAAYSLDSPKRMNGGAVVQGPGAEPVPVTLPPAAYRADRRTVARSIEAWDLFQLLDLMIGGMSVSITREQWQALSGDVRRHFAPIREE